MKSLFIVAAFLVLTSCIGNVRSANVILSEPDESSVVRTLTVVHRLSINQNRMLIYNGEEKLRVPEGQQVVFNIIESGEPTFTLEDK